MPDNNNGDSKPPEDGLSSANFLRRLTVFYFITLAIAIGLIIALVANIRDYPGAAFTVGIVALGLSIWSLCRDFMEFHAFAKNNQKAAETLPMKKLWKHFAPSLATVLSVSTFVAMLIL